MPIMNFWISAFIGVLIGAVFMWIFLFRRVSKRDLNLSLLEQKNILLQENITKKEHDIEALQKKINTLDLELVNLKEQNAVLATKMQANDEAGAEKIALLQDYEQRLKKEFSLISQQVLQERTKQTNLDLEQVLKPFKEQLQDFSKKTQELYTNEAKERFSLQNEIKNLHQLNKQISQDAINLTNALKQQAKTQGNWGEMVLERILELSGLRKNYEYKTQASFNAQGKQFRPDVVVFLPENKQIIIDAKVSLTAYERFVNAKEDDEKKLAIKEHLHSINTHLKALSEKSYEDLEEIVSLDFVLMFVPIEGAFLLALEQDNEFFANAFDKNIIIVSPSTLTVTLKTIHSIWKYEYQNNNALEIAQKAGAMLDKFVSFSEDLGDVSRHIARAQESVQKAQNKLEYGKGNLQKRASELITLGVKSKKFIASNEDVTKIQNNLE